jgi:hypothetical protein
VSREKFSAGEGGHRVSAAAAYPTRLPMKKPAANIKWFFIVLSSLQL